MALDACAALEAADKALLDLMTGRQARVVVDQNGERVEFTMTNKQQLVDYMTTLQGQCTTYQAIGLPRREARPMRFVF